MYSDKCNELLKRIKKNRFNDISLQLNLCDELYDIAEKQHIEKKVIENIKATALYYKAEALYSQTPADAEKYAKECITFAEDEKNPEILARSYNLLGIIAYGREELSMSLDYYLHCNKLSQKHGLDHILGLCACNIGVIFQMLEACDKAVPYFKTAVECFERNVDDPTARENLASVYSNLFDCYFKLGKIENACKCLEFLRANVLFLDAPFILDLCEAEYFSMIDDPGQMKNSLTQAVHNALNVDTIIELIDSFQMLCDFLFRQEQYSSLIKILDRIDEYIESDIYPKVRIIFIKYRLYCIEKQCDFNEYSKWSKEYIRTYEKITTNFHQSVLESVNLRLYVEELKVAGSELELRSMTDSLTQIYNRAGFNHYVDPLFKKAIDEQLPVSFSLIDIDYFKQINDHYGHPYGDQCLQKIAELLLRSHSEEVIVSRYGGDEFLVFTIGKDFDAVQGLTAVIRASVDNLQIKAEKSLIADHMTLSQGIFYGIPAEADTVPAFIHKADLALYKVKEGGRDGFIIDR